MTYKVAVVGATGMVGTEVLSIMAERLFPADEVFALASRGSMGREVSYGDKTLRCLDLEQFDFRRADIAVFAAGGSISEAHAPKAADLGCVVIDNSSHFRLDDDVPLVVPEVNADAVEGFRKRGIVANPNCSTAQLVVALKPLHDRFGIKRVVVSTYQSVSGAGKDASDELFTQTRGIFVNDEPTPSLFTKQIAFNVIPHIDTFMPDGSTREEDKLSRETSKIMGADIPLTATAVRVPVFVGHSEAVNVEFHREAPEDAARDLLRDSPGLLVIDKREDGGYVTPVECVGEFATFVSRIRRDPTVPHGLNLWVVSDNLRKGAALNAVQIAEVMASRGLIEARE